MLGGRTLAWLLSVVLSVASGSTVIWRLRKADGMLLQWRVYELELMSDTACSGGIIEPQPHSAVVVSQNVAEGSNAFDGSTTTAWTSGACTISCFIGQTFPSSTVVRCVRLFQDSDRAFSSFTASLEYSTTGANGLYTSTATYTYLAGGFWIQLDPLWQLPGLRTRWRITNTALISSAWRIMEFRLYSDTSCEVPIEHNVPLSSEYSSFSNPLSALDGDLTTSWSSICSLGGCPSYSAWIGIHLPRDVASVACLKLYQSAISSELTTNLAVQYWDGVATWSTFRTFSSLVGGVELFLSGMPYKTAWRVTNGETSLNTVQINEVRFFYDAQCNNRVVKDIFLSTEPHVKAISSPKKSDSSEVSSVFDDTFTNPGWRSSCSNCNPNEAYVGIQFTDATARDIACVNVFLEPSLSVRNLQLQFIGTIKWEVLYNVVYTSGGYWLSLTSLANSPILPSRIYPMYGNPFYRVRISGTWSPIKSIAFYPNTECRGAPVAGTPVASVGLTGHEPVFPFLAQAEDWEAATPDGWIGIILSDSSVSVGCVQITEVKRKPGQFKTITLEQLNQWPAETFSPIQTFIYDDSSSASSTALQIGYEADTLWRLRRADSFAGIPSGANWRISELMWYSSPDCSGSPGTGVLLGSSVLTQGTTDLAKSSDADLATYWQPSSQDFIPWLGVSFGRNPYPVGCVKLYQPIESFYAARVANLEKSDPLTRAWILDRQLNFLSGGIWLTLTTQFTLPAPDMLWRVVNIAPMGKRLFWQVRKLRLFSDVQCTDEIQGIGAGWAVASGYSSSDAPRFSSGENPDKQWAAQCDYCSSYQAWIGVLLPDQSIEKDPRCAEITTNVGLDILKWELEKFTGQDVPECATSPSDRSCWTSLTTSTRKSCVYSSDGIVCGEIVYVTTTPRPETVYVESESIVLVLAAYVAPATVVISMIICCCALLNTPKEDTRPIEQLFVYPTYLWFLFWIAVLLIAILLSFWLLTMAVISALVTTLLFGTLLLPTVLLERTRAKTYVYAAGPLKKHAKSALVVIFAVQQVGMCLFDACLFRVTGTYLGFVQESDFVSWLSNLCLQLRGLVDFTSPASFRCGGSSLIFASVTIVAGLSVFLAVAAYDVIAMSECSNIAALLSRRPLVYATVSSLSGVFFGLLQVVALACAGALFHGFADASQMQPECRTVTASEASPVAIHAPSSVYLFGSSCLWVVAILYVLPVFVSFLSGHFFPSGIDPRMAQFLCVPELAVATADQKAEDLAALASAAAETAGDAPGKKRPIAPRTGRTISAFRPQKSAGVDEGESEMDAIFHVFSDVYKNVFSSIPLLIGRAVPGPFRISERAKFHTAAFQLPDAPLLPIQRASVRLVSLIWQAIPVGIFIGKFADYLCLTPVRTSLAASAGSLAQVTLFQTAGLCMYLCVVTSGAFLSSPLLATLFLIVAMTLAGFRATLLGTWVARAPEPSLAPATAEQHAEAQTAAVPFGNQVVAFAN